MGGYEKPFISIVTWLFSCVEKASEHVALWGLYNSTAEYIDGCSGALFFKEISHAKKYKIDKPGSNSVHDMTKWISTFKRTQYTVPSTPP